MDIPTKGSPIYVTNYIYMTTITVPNSAAQLQQVRSDCIWVFPRTGKIFTNTVITYRAPGQGMTTWFQSMKLPTNSSRARAAGFTLVEMLTVVTIFAPSRNGDGGDAIIRGAHLHLCGDEADRRPNLDQGHERHAGQIRQATQVDVGIYNTTANTFSLIGNGSNQIGNALQIMPTNPGISSVGTIFFMNQSPSNICSVVISNGAVLPATIKQEHRHVYHKLLRF